MLPIACQTAEPNGLKFFVDTQGFPVGAVQSISCSRIVKFHCNVLGVQFATSL